MRQVSTTIGHAPVSAIGFGCASIGSWVTADEGLRALERAFDAGVTWFDVAPSYGDGAAETILGRFLAGRAGAVNVCTKVGIVAVSTGWKAALRPHARRLVRRFPALRRYARGVRTIETTPLTTAGVAASVDESLRRLGVERIDLLMIHDPLPRDVLDGAVEEALTMAIEAGKVGAVGVAGDLEAVAAGAERPRLFAALQTENNPFESRLQDRRLADWRSAGRLTIAHGALNVFGALPRLRTLLAEDPATRRRLADAGYDPAAPTTPAEMLTDYALATNASGLCLFSAIKPRHLSALVARADAARDPAEMLDLGAALAERWRSRTAIKT
ncbi:aldo/keto reductase [Methylopila sp. 73B]|uniref:aldo/keto reductase n=1 Tax=Methylopila sp. 73B TaxID=1120792 RepID=UPI0003647B5E|nr:aldo/keto reductase [Methylopila sp. 73B]